MKKPRRFLPKPKLGLPASPRRFATVTGLSLALVPLATSPALTPAYGSVPPFVIAAASPTLTRSGTDLVITGSVGKLFKSAVFTGPNRAAKTDRARPDLGALAVAQTFARVREEIASLREPVRLSDTPDLKNALEERVHAMQATEIRTEVAAVDPALMSAALAAIDKASPGGPVPEPLPSQLAYARDTAPATRFSTPTEMKVSAKQFNCLATAIYFEARGESDRGQAAVAQVVMNRVKSSLYPQTICGVVYQNHTQHNACQFSFACDGIPDRINEPKAWTKAKKIAGQVLDGEIYLTDVANATHYHATYVYPKWAKHMQRLTKIGLHVFYRFKSG